MYPALRPIQGDSELKEAIERLYALDNSNPETGSPADDERGACGTCSRLRTETSPDLTLERSWLGCLAHQSKLSNTLDKHL